MLYRWSSRWGDAMSIEAIIPLVIMGSAFLLIAIVAHASGQGNLDHIKSKTVGDGQHGTARWATKKEIQQTFQHIPFRPDTWRKGKDLPADQGLVLGCVGGGPAGNAAGERRQDHRGPAARYRRPLPVHPAICGIISKNSPLPLCTPQGGSFCLEAGRFECAPRCSAHHQRKNYFKFRGSETPAGVSEPHFHRWGREGKRHLQRLLSAKARRCGCARSPLGELSRSD